MDHLYSANCYNKQVINPGRFFQTQKSLSEYNYCLIANILLTESWLFTHNFGAGGLIDPKLGENWSIWARIICALCKSTTFTH